MRRLAIAEAGGQLADWRPAVDWLRAGRLVVFPTDTVYGLSVDPTSRAAILDLFDLKGRPETSALPFVAASRAQVERWCGPLGGISGRLADAFWPGPLTLLVAAPAAVDPAVLGGTDSLAIRVPGHPAARQFAEAWGAPIPATSANRSGGTPARIVADLDAIVDDARVLVIDAGPTPGGAPSTIVDARGSVVRLVRDGAIAWNRVLDCVQG